MNKGSYTLDILVKGSVVGEYVDERNGDHYIEGKNNSEFTLRIKNTSRNRILTVVSVDGLSVMDGKPASYESQGYVIQPWGTLKIPGWRLSDAEIAKFVFNKSEDSYAAQKGDGSNIGVIGCAIFEEEEIDPYVFIHYRDTAAPEDMVKWTYSDCDGTTFLKSQDSTTSSCFLSSSSSSSASCSAGVNTRSGHIAKSKSIVDHNNIGTGFGKKSEHKVSMVNFSRPEKPTEILEIKYDDRYGLKEKGIYLGSVHHVNAFPKEEYCEPPKNWQA